MSAPRLPGFVLVVSLIFLVATQNTSGSLWYQLLTDPMNNEMFRKVDQFTRSRHPSELQGATTPVVQLATDNSTYRSTYSTTDGSQYTTVVRVDGPSITEAFWGKVDLPPPNEQLPESLVAQPQLAGGWQLAEDYQNDEEFRLVDSFVREAKKQELDGARTIEVRTQVVSGINYNITYENNRGQAYSAIVYRQPWTNTTKLSVFQKTVLPLGMSIVRGGPLLGTTPQARGVRVGNFRPVTNLQEGMFVEAEKFVRQKYPRELANAVLRQATEQVVAGKNFRMIFDSPTGQYEAVVWNQPWTKTLEVTRWTVIEQKQKKIPQAMAVSSSAPIASFAAVTDYKNDASFNQIDNYIKQQNKELVNAEIIAVERRQGASIQYKIKYRTTDRIYTIQASIEESPMPAPTNPRRLLQTAGSFVQLTDFGNDGNFQSADRLTRREKPDLLARADVVKAERMDLPDAFNYRLTYRTATGNASSVVYIQPSSGSVRLINFETATIENTGPITPSAIAALNSPQININNIGGSSMWQQLTSFSDITLQRVDQLVRARNPLIGGGTLSKMWQQGSNTYRLLYTLSSGGTFETAVTYNRQNNSIFQIFKNESQKSTVISTTSTAALDSQGFANIANFNTDGNFRIIDSYLRRINPRLNNAVVQSVRVLNGRQYKVVYRNAEGALIQTRTDLQQLQNLPQTTTTTTTSTTTTFAPLTNFSTDEMFLVVDRILRSRYPSFSGAMIQSVDQINNGVTNTYKIKYLLPNRDITEVTSTYSQDSRNVDVGSINQLGKSTQELPTAPLLPANAQPVPIPVPVVIPSPEPVVTPPTPIPIPVPVAPPTTTTTTTTTTQQVVSTPERQGFVSISNFLTNPNVQRILLLIRSREAINNMVLIGVWVRQLTDGINIYRLRFRSANGQIREIDQTDIEPTPLPASQSTSTTQQTTTSTTVDNGKELIDFQNDPKVREIDQVIRRDSNLGKSTIMKVVVSTNAEGLSRYTLTYFDAERAASASFTYEYTKDQGTTVNRPQSVAGDKVLFTTEDGYEMQGNWGINPIVRNADSYIRSAKPEIAGSSIDTVWKREFPEGTGLKILYVNRQTQIRTLIEVLARRSGNFQMVPAANLVAPTTTTTQTITTTTTKQQPLNDFITNSEFQVINKFIKNTLSLGAAIPIAVWYQTANGIINFRINYIYEDGSLQEIYARYNTATKVSEVVGSPTELSKATRVRQNNSSTVTKTEEQTTTQFNQNPSWTPQPVPKTPPKITKIQQKNTTTTTYFPGITKTAEFVFNKTVPEVEKTQVVQEKVRPPTPGLIDWNNIISTNTSRTNTTIATPIRPVVPSVTPTIQITTEQTTTKVTPPAPNLPQVPKLPDSWDELLRNRSSVTTTINTSDTRSQTTIRNPSSTSTSTTSTSTPIFDITVPRLPTLPTTPTIPLSSGSSSTTISTATVVPNVQNTVLPSSILLLPSVPVISGIQSGTTISRQQEIDIDGADVRRLDRFIRTQRDDIINHQIMTVWRLIGSDSFRIIYVSLNERDPSFEIIITRLPNDQLVINSITKTTSIISSMGRFASFRDYQKDPEFARVDRFCRETAQLGVTARVIDVWYQFLPNAINYRIQYQLWDGSVEQIIVSRQRNTDRLQIISRKTVVARVDAGSTTTTTTTSSSSSTSSSTQMLTPVITSPPAPTVPILTEGMENVLTTWSTDRDFLIVDRFVRSQFPQFRNSQIVSVSFVIKTGVSVTYRIVYSGQTNAVVVTRNIGSDQLTLVSSGLGKSGFQPYTTYTTDIEFSKVDAFARSQLPQLRNASIRNVWIEFILGNNYKIEYVTNQNIVIEVVISWDQATESYVFELISPLNLLQFIVGKDPLCKIFKRNTCLECSFRSYFDSNRRCRQVNPQCNTFDVNNGACLTCYSGYSISNGNCVLTETLLPPNCLEISNAGQCIRCSIGYTINAEGKCIERMPGCQTFLPDGRCINCSIGYLMFDGTCRRQY